MIPLLPSPTDTLTKINSPYGLLISGTPGSTKVPQIEQNCAQSCSKRAKKLPKSEPKVTKINSPYGLLISGTPGATRVTQIGHTLSKISLTIIQIAFPGIQCCLEEAAIWKHKPPKQTKHPRSGAHSKQNHFNHNSDNTSGHPD